MKIGEESETLFFLRAVLICLISWKLQEINLELLKYKILPRIGSNHIFELMPTPLTSGEYLADNANLAKSVFHNVNLSQASFDDVNLRGAVFNNVALTGATIRDACLKDFSIQDAGYEGMKIDGILVTELLRVYRERQGS
jgi:Pentapeptide repeats (8 copies)